MLFRAFSNFEAMSHIYIIYNSEVAQAQSMLFALKTLLFYKCKALLFNFHFFLFLISSPRRLIYVSLQLAFTPLHPLI